MSLGVVVKYNQKPPPNRRLMGKLRTKKWKKN